MSNCIGEDCPICQKEKAKREVKKNVEIANQIKLNYKGIPEMIIETDMGKQYDWNALSRTEKLTFKKVNLTFFRKCQAAAAKLRREYEIQEMGKL